MPGLNVITGETGAGKSILIDAVGALLGDRLGPEVVRSGAQRALDRRRLHLADAAARRAERRPGRVRPGARGRRADRQPRDRRQRRSRRRAHQRPRRAAVGAAGARRAAGRRPRPVRAHGAAAQPRSSSTTSIATPGCWPSAPRSAGWCASCARRAPRTRSWSPRSARRRACRTCCATRSPRSKLPSCAPTRRPSCASQRARLEHVERLRQSALTASRRWPVRRTTSSPAPPICSAGRSPPARTPAGSIRRWPAKPRRSQPRWPRPRSRRARCATTWTSVEADPQALERTAERLFQIGDLKRKYGESIADILAYADEAARRLAEIDQRSERLDELPARDSRAAKRELAARRMRLSARRQAAAAQLSRSRRARARTTCAWRARASTFADRARSTSTVDGAGIDRVEFLLAASDDEPRSMARVASGGELARIALALKTVLCARRDAADADLRRDRRRRRRADRAGGRREAVGGGRRGPPGAVCDPHAPGRRLRRLPLRGQPARPEGVRVIAS